MKRFSIILLAIAVAFVMALPAGAKGPPDKPDKPGKPPETLIGMTCKDAKFDTWDLYKGLPFTLRLEKREVACVDVVAPKGDWTVNVIDAEGVRDATIRVQDSVSPGDVCGDDREDMIDGVLTTGDIFTIGPVPAAGPDACGTFFGDNYDDEDNPLVFLAFGPSGKKGTYFIIEVTPPQSQP